VSKEVEIELKRSPDDVDPVVANLTELKTNTRGTYAINIAWNKAQNATGYVVYKAVGGKWIRVGATAKTNYTFGSLASGTSYAFAVRPYANHHGKIIWSAAHKSVSSFTKPLKSAKMVNSLSGYTAIKTTWTKSVGATGYAVYKVVGGKYVRVANVTTNTYTFGGLKRNTAYKFAVRPYKISGGQVAYSDAITTLTTRTKR
jgi:predicted TIM-barrel enzyme